MAVYSFASKGKLRMEQLVALGGGGCAIWHSRMACPSHSTVQTTYAGSEHAAHTSDLSAETLAWLQDLALVCVSVSEGLTSFAPNMSDCYQFIVLINNALLARTPVLPIVAPEL